MDCKNLRKIVLEDGSEYVGTSFGSGEEKIAELVFNTSMVGYQEIISDPSYTDQAVVMTYPLIGNYGICDEDYETKIPSISALIVRDYSDLPSNFRQKETLSEVMDRFHIAGIAGVDTRKITRHIRDFGSCRVIICDAAVDTKEALLKLQRSEVKTDAVSRVSTKEAYKYEFTDNDITTSGLCSEQIKDDGKGKKVVVIDCGIKKNILRSMAGLGLELIVVPYYESADKILSYKPDGVFISNGPGDPTDVKETINTIKELIGKVPIFGICLGHQIIALAYGASTYKLKFGHRGGNHPVKNLLTDKIEITSQNHSYAVDVKSLEATKLKATHINLLDDTIEGAMCEEDKVFSVQYHPESAPGPQDSAYLFDKFISLL